MVDVVPREVPRPKPEGPKAPWVSAAGPPEAQHSPSGLQKDGNGGNMFLSQLEILAAAFG